MKKRELFGVFFLFLLVSQMVVAIGLSNEMSYSSPLSFWKFESNTLNVIDEMNNHNGSLQNGGKYVEGVDGKAIELDGEDDWIEVKDHEDLNPSNFSVTFWSKFKSFKGYNGLIGKAGNGQGESYQKKGWTTEVTTTQVSMWIWDDSSWQTISCSNDLALNKWYFFAFLYNGTGIEMYINGSLMAQKNGIDDFIPSNESMHIGSVYPYDPHGLAVMGNLNGTLDEVAFFNSSLTNETINEIYENGITLPEEEEEQEEILTIGNLFAFFGLGMLILILIGMVLKLRMDFANGKSKSKKRSKSS